MTAIRLTYCTIYCITNLVNGKKYVGQTGENPLIRWNAHKSAVNRPKSGNYRALITKAIQKYGEENFEFSVLTTCPPFFLDVAEQRWIAKLGTFGPAGYNLTSGGQQGWRADASVGQRVSAARKGKKLSPEHCAKISANQLGRPQSAESNRKRSEKLKGRAIGPFTDERKAAISAGMSEAGKARSRAAHIGKKRSEETKAALRAAWVIRRARTENGAHA